MIETIISKINNCISTKPLLPYKIDHYFLSKLYYLLLKECVPYDMIQHYLVAFGLLNLHIDCHQHIQSDLPIDELSGYILDGDYFYSLYYQYCATHAFTLIDQDFAQVLKAAEINAIDDTFPSLLGEIKEFFAQGGSNHELLS
ncbi:MAG: hypothetical protein ACRCST_07290 [Turicibacter sp.]